MEQLEKVTDHLKQIDDDFYGQVIIKVRAGRAVHIVEERSFKLDDVLPQRQGQYQKD